MCTHGAMVMSFSTPLLSDLLYPSANLSDFWSSVQLPHCETLAFTEKIAHHSCQSKWVAQVCWHNNSRICVWWRLHQREVWQQCRCLVDLPMKYVRVSIMHFEVWIHLLARGQIMMKQSCFPRVKWPTLTGKRELRTMQSA